MSENTAFELLGTVPAPKTEGSVAEFLLWLQEAHGSDTPVAFFLANEGIRVFKAVPATPNITALATIKGTSLMKNIRDNLDLYHGISSTLRRTDVTPFIEMAYRVVEATPETISGSFFPRPDESGLVSVTIRPMVRSGPGRWIQKDTRRPF